MDITLYSLAFVVGGLASYLIFKRRRGPFEQAIWTSLANGKRVILSIDEDAYIYEMNGDKVRISRATAELLPVEDDYGYNQLATDDLVSEQSDQSDSSDDSLH